jgi:hypothetical protein
MQISDTATRSVRGIQVLLLAAIAVLLWSDWRARRADDERLRRVEQTLKELGREVARASAAQASVQPPSAVSAILDREALAQRVVGLMRASLPPSAAPCDEQDAEPEPKSEPEPKTFGPNEEAKAREAEQVVSASLASGHLRVEDVMRLRNLESASKGHPDFVAMRTRIIAAVNDQRLVPEDMAFVAF